MASLVELILIAPGPKVQRTGLHLPRHLLSLVSCFAVLLQLPMAHLLAGHGLCGALGEVSEHGLWQDDLGWLAEHRIRPELLGTHDDVALVWWVGVKPMGHLRHKPP